MCTSNNNVSISSTQTTALRVYSSSTKTDLHIYSPSTKTDLCVYSLSTKTEKTDLYMYSSSTKTENQSKKFSDLHDISQYVIAEVTNNIVYIWNSVSSQISQTWKSINSYFSKKKLTETPQQKHESTTYSLNEVLADFPKTYKKPTYEAVAKIVPEKEMATIQLKKLTGGHSNSKILKFEVGDKKYVLRTLDLNDPIEIRRSEIAAHQNAATLKIAPNLAYVDQDCSVMVMEYIEGRTLSRADLGNNELVRKVMRALRKFHSQCQEDGIIKEPRAEALRRHYVTNLKKGTTYPTGFDFLHEKFQEELANLHIKNVPTHGDFHLENILLGKNGNVYIIDWATARLDNPLFDIARLACRAVASDDQTRNLFREYLGRDPNQSEIRTILLGKDLLALNKANRWLNLQKERDPKKLQALFEGTLKNMDEYTLAGIRPEDMPTSSTDLTRYALSWVKEFIENHYHMPVAVFLKTLKEAKTC